MPFTTARRYPTSPLLSVYFSGLLIIKPNNDGTSCNIGVHHEPRHKLKVFLKINRPNEPAIRKILQLGPLARDFQILNSSQTGVFAFKPVDNFNRNLAVDDRRDLRWSVNLENSEFNNEPFALVPGSASPGITINSGVFSTAERTDETSVNIVKSRQGLNATPVNSIASVIEARIELTGADHIFLVPNNLPPVLLPRSEDLLGTTYELEISNEPPDDFADLDELDHYYEVLTKENGDPITDDEKWHLSVAQAVVDSDAKSDEIPCMPIVLEP